MPPGKSCGPPNGSRSPCTTRTGAPTPRSSGNRDFSGRLGGTSGKARHTTPAAPHTVAVRQATRAPLLRPPVTSGGSAKRARKAATTVIHASSSRGAGAGAGNTVGLVDPGDRPAPRGGVRGDRHEVGSVGAAACAVAETQQPRLPT